MTRRRWPYIVAVIALIAVGLPLRLLPASQLPTFLVTYAGDALWAAAVYLVLVAALPHLHPLHAWFTAMGFSFAIEFSQLYQANWINAVRGFHVLGFPIAGIVLGYGFLWSDLLAYTIGILAALLFDLRMRAIQTSGTLSPHTEEGSEV